MRRFRLDPLTAPIALEADALHPRHGPLPQARLRELYGNEYNDVLNGFGPVLFGHAPPLVTEVTACQRFSRSM